MPELTRDEFEERNVSSAVRCVPKDFAGFKGVPDDRVWCRMGAAEVRGLGGTLPQGHVLYRGHRVDFDAKARPLVILHEQFGADIGEPDPR